MNVIRPLCRFAKKFNTYSSERTLSLYCGNLLSSMMYHSCVTTCRSVFAHVCGNPSRFFPSISKRFSISACNSQVFHKYKSYLPFFTCQANHIHTESLASSNENGDRSLSWYDVRGQPSPVNVKFTVLQLDEVVELIREEGGEDVVVIKIPEEMCYVDYFITVTAGSSRHLVSIVEMINKLYKKKRMDSQPYAIIEGKNKSEDWHCIDIGNMVIHVMLAKTRSTYDLEELWLLGPNYDDKLQKIPTTEEIIQQLTVEGLNLMSVTDDTVKALGSIDNPWFNDADVTSQSSADADDKRDEDDDAFLV